jgi:hypothetical protein
MSRPVPLKVGGIEPFAVPELAIEVGPNDLHTVIGLAQALEEVGRTAEADESSVKAPARKAGPIRLEGLVCAYLGR